MKFCRNFAKDSSKHFRYFDKNVRKIRKMLEISGIDAKVHSFSSLVQSYPYSRVCGAVNARVTAACRAPRGVPVPKMRRISVRQPKCRTVELIRQFFDEFFFSFWRIFRQNSTKFDKFRHSSSNFVKFRQNFVKIRQKFRQNSTWNRFLKGWIAKCAEKRLKKSWNGAKICGAKECRSQTL